MGQALASAGRVIAIDGPAGSGKSTTARGVAERLAFVHLNSGLLYRAITWLALRRGWREDDPDFGDRVERLHVEWERTGSELRVRLEGADPGPELHSREVSARVSGVARHPIVRRRVLAWLRQAAAKLDVVCDGRDIGTVVFPSAPLKVFLVASIDERARRRLLDLGEEPSEQRIGEEAQRLHARDVADSTRDLSPLRRAEDAVEIDTTDLSPEAVVGRIVELAKRRGLVDPG
ncbi:MAG: (d)CMP kinase [Gemmatimonadota bacterium]